MERVRYADMTCTGEHYLSGEEEGTLLRIARDSLTAWTLEERRVGLVGYALTDVLLEKHGAFVTLRAGDA
jgi:AMMECR1 domain-containing protein